MQSTYVSRLDATRNPDGGWGYYPGKQSRLEPTSLALIALSLQGNPRGGLLFPWSCFRERDGLLLDPAADAPNPAFNAQAALTYQALGEPSRAEGLVERLLVVKARTYARSDTVLQDTSLAAWPWRDETISWVEPTAWCLLAVKRVQGSGRSQLARERIDVGERMLADRMCVGGGWNYGNSVVFGRALPPHLPTTALALLALADKPSLPAVPDSLRYLVERRLGERSGLSLSLARICLQRYAIAADDLSSSLADTWAETSFMQNVPATALAAIAMATRDSTSDPFHV